MHRLPALDLAHALHLHHHPKVARGTCGYGIGRGDDDPHLEVLPRQGFPGDGPAWGLGWGNWQARFQGNPNPLHLGRSGRTEIPYVHEFDRGGPGSVPADRDHLHDDLRVAGVEEASAKGPFSERRGGKGGNGQATQDQAHENSRHRYLLICAPENTGVFFCWSRLPLPRTKAFVRWQKAARHQEVYRKAHSSVTRATSPAAKSGWERAGPTKLNPGLGRLPRPGSRARSQGRNLAGPVSASTTTNSTGRSERGSFTMW